MKYNVVIIGAGPAGIAAYNLLEGISDLKVTIVEAGNNLHNRVKYGSKRKVINGFGGAGLFADRKFSTFPAGSGQLKSNPYELRDSYTRTLYDLETALPSNEDKFKLLLDKTLKFLGDNTLSSEELERKVKSLSFESLKLYPSIVLSDVDDAIDLIKFYEDHIKEGDLLLDTQVVDIRHHSENGKYLLHLTDTSNENILEADYIILAMGRYGSLSLPKFTLFKDDLHLKLRLEIGLRVNIDSSSALFKALSQLTNQEMIADPKFKIRRNFMIKGRNVMCEFRTFCVCLPSHRGSLDDLRSHKEGYVVNSEDKVTGISTFSGSSSYDELTKMQNLPYVQAGSNMGIMMRITDPETIAEYYKEVTERCRKVEASTLLIKIDDLDKSLDRLAKYFPKELCYPLYSGVLEMIHSISKEDLKEDLLVHLPCIEGTGIYPKVDPRTYQYESFDNIFVAGDMVGHSRGLLQALTMGDMVAKILLTVHRERLLKEKGMLLPYQSLLMPSHVYNKTISYPNLESDDLYQGLKNCFLESLQEIDQVRIDEIYSSMHRVHSKSPLIGVIYELHHFFLDRDVYGKNEQLHYISQKAMIEYIFLCNVIEANREALAMSVLRHLKYQTSLDSDTYSGLAFELISTFLNHQFKSCILALRTRKSLEERDNYTDIPVMQSAFKISPGNGDHDPLIVATTCAFLDSFFKKAIEKFDLSLLLVRSKIETQEPAIVSVDPETNPLYLECHVKVNIMNSDGSDAEYYTKKHIIQELASLFEGDDALIRDIFKIISVSINLLKHPEHGQQFFLTYRTDSKEEMEFIRKNFTKIMNTTLQLLPLDSELRKFRFSFYTDAEFVIYDDNRALDEAWFPIKANFMPVGYKENITSFLTAPRKLFVMTQNQNKMEEMRNLISEKSRGQVAVIQCQRMNLETISEVDLIESVKLKIEKAYQILNQPVIVESTGLIIEGMNGFPGSQTKEILEMIGTDAFLRLVGEKGVIAQTVIGYHDGLSAHISEASVKGKLCQARGDGGFGWDSLFVPETSNKTFALMSPTEKSQHSMRTLALNKFLDHYN